MNCKKAIFLRFLIFLGGLNICNCKAGKIDSFFKHNVLKFGVEGGYYYYDFVKDNVVLLPLPLSQRRYKQFVSSYLGRQSLQGLWGLAQNSNQQNLLTDNPLIHGAGFLTLHFSDVVSEKFDILGSLTAEQRGTSYGVFNTANRIVFPQFRLRYHDTFNIAKNKLSVTGSVGNYNNIRTDEGLIYYNIDAEGIYFKLSYLGFTYEHMHIADLLYSYGLNIDDGVTNSLYFTTKKSKRGETWRFGAGYDLNDQIYSPMQVQYQQKVYRNFYTLYAAWMPDTVTRIYLQTGILEGGRLDDMYSNALVAGVKKMLKHKNFNISGHAEIRYYGSNFKYNFWDQVVYYRSINPTVFPGNYGNSIGPNLYPLRNYERPFSQFAVFTEPAFNSYSIAGATLYLDGEVCVYKYLFFSMNLDANYMTWFSSNIHLSDILKMASYTYPFYKTGFFIKPAKGVKIFAGLTNRGMNLDNTYQTLYLMRSPYYYFELTKTIDGFLER